jgi:hypothetical protein
LKIIGVSLALGSVYKNAGTGEMIMPPDGAVMRFGALASFIERTSRSVLYSKTILCCFAGHSSKNPTQPTEHCKVSLGEQLRRFVRTNCPSWLQELRTGSDAWSTYGEIRRAIIEGHNEGFGLTDPDVTLVVSSNLAHLIRIWLICIWLKPAAWKLKLVRAHHYFSLRSLLGEPFAIIKNLLMRFKLKDFQFRQFMSDRTRGENDD